MRWTPAACPARLLAAWLTLLAAHPCAPLPQVAVGPGRLQRHSWADAGRRWRTFHYELPLPVPPCQLGFAVGPFRMAATALPGPAAGAAASGGAQPEAAQLTHFAPQRPPAELAVAAVLASQPSVARDAGGCGGSGGAAAAVASDGLARSAHFTGLAWSFFEELLGCSCPLPALQQAFLPAELQLGGRAQVGAGLQLLSTAQLIQPRAIEQSSEFEAGWGDSSGGPLSRPWVTGPRCTPTGHTPSPVLFTHNCRSRGALRHGPRPGAPVVWRAAAGGHAAGRVAGGGCVRLRGGALWGCTTVAIACVPAFSSMPVHRASLPFANPNPPHQAWAAGWRSSTCGGTWAATSSPTGGRVGPGPGERGAPWAARPGRPACPAQCMAALIRCWHPNHAQALARAAGHLPGGQRGGAAAGCAVRAAAASPARQPEPAGSTGCSWGDHGSHTERTFLPCPAPPHPPRSGLSAPSPWGPLYGSERLEPSQLWSAKVRWAGGVGA